MNRDEVLKSFRDTLDINNKGSKKEVEAFMHNCLRPILKFQNTAILKLISNSSHFKTLNLKRNSTEETHLVLSNVVKRNTALKNQLIGITLALFSVLELDFYFKNAKELNKRIINMCVTRFISQLS